LITGINSDLPGQITAQVRSNVYDSIAGNYLLIPQGAKITGLYDSQIAYGQERILVAWKRIIFPNGKSIDLQGMPGVDMRGYAGLHDQVDNHYGKIFGSVILMSLLGAGGQLAQPQNSNNPWQSPTVGQTVAQSLGTNIANTGTMITSRNINIQPTLEISPGYEFNISVTKDIIFPGSYHE
jgi:type IV secretion system protein VirB10